MAINRSVAFFISPQGEILPVKANHIGAVIDNPQQFGLTVEEIKSRYSRHNERLGTEGNARREILLQVVSSGWIRLRWYRNQYWSVTVHALTKNVLSRLQNWAIRILSGIDGVCEDDPYMPVRITQLDGTLNEDYNISDLASLKLP